MKRILFAFFAASLLASPATAGLPLDPIDRITGERFERDGSVPARVNDLSTPSYALMDNENLWRDIAKSDHKVFVAVKRTNERRGFFRGKLFIEPQEVSRAKASMLESHRGLREYQPPNDRQLPRTVNGMVFPGFYASIDSIETLSQLRRRLDIDYIEPLYLFPLDSCSPDPIYQMSQDPGLVDDELYYFSSPDIVPHTFGHMRITDAWDRVTGVTGPNQAPGSGIKLAVLDTGVSLDQEQLWSRFTTGALRSPPVHHDHTGSGLDDTCGHGTKVAAIATAPNDGRNIVGAMWGADLLTAKVGNMVAKFPGGSDVASVCGAILDAQVSGADVVTMSFGFSSESPTVRECITNAFDTTSMIFVAAAGTTVPWVVFPANMNREVIAASVVHIDGQSTYRLFGSGIAYGPEVDFVSVMGDSKIPAAGPMPLDVITSGGTSMAVPHIASVFGLAVQTHPTWTRAQIISLVAQSSSVEHITQTDGSPLGPNAVGFGIPNAYKITGGTTRFDVIAPTQVQAGQTITVSGTNDGSGLSYYWSYTLPGQLYPQYQYQPSISITPTTPGSFWVYVIATDPVDGRSFTKFTTITVTAAPVPPPTTITLTSLLSAWHNPYWASGGQFDQKINAGKAMPAGCIVTARRGRLQCPFNGAEVDCPTTIDEMLGSYGARGFLIDPFFGAPNSLETNVRYWHDGWGGVAVRVKYTVTQPHGVNCNVPGATF